MNIAVIGAGNVGGTLGTRWAKLGHQVAFGVRNPADPKIQKLLSAAGAKVHAASPAEAVATATVVALTVPWDAVQSAVQSAGDLSGKVLIDATNPVLLGAEGLSMGLAVGHTTSGAEQIASW